MAIYRYLLSAIVKLGLTACGIGKQTPGTRMEIIQALPRDPATPHNNRRRAHMSTQIFEVNPYENHPELSQTEAEVLWEYAKLNQRLKIVSVPFLRPFHLYRSLSQDDCGDQATQPIA